MLGKHSPGPQILRTTEMQFWSFGGRKYSPLESFQAFIGILPTPTNRSCIFCILGLELNSNEEKALTVYTFIFIKCH